ncbi:MAG: helix-hairpin-helix domain-containing protein [Deltaproteobacteria bacterium]|nr:helix-hairpin-helix domain-containing protein [Deltaproteobacteria bacterium]
MKRSVLMALLATILTVTPLLAGAKRLEGVLNLNTASVQELTLLPGVGESKAKAIIAYRQAHPFKAAEELTEVKGFGQGMLRKIEKHLAVQGPSTLHEVAP